MDNFSNDKAVLTVGTVILDKEKVLLVRHTKNASHLTGTYGLPAGKVEPGETIIAAAIREVREETGLQVDKKNISRLPTSYCAIIKQKDMQKRMIYIVYYANEFAGQIKDSQENEPEWIEIDKLDSINLLPNVHDAINEAVEIISI
ncbi:MAG: NUDIX hydrolase [Candidatus Dojkabacteria bacterium]|nr:NUDIX hydrolase [Candidatus Dojkabacteria bacterium]